MEFLIPEPIGRRETPTSLIYELGCDIPVGAVPSRMHAWAIRRDRHGDPKTAFRHEVIDVPTIGHDEVLILVMAAGVNYNGVWAALGHPVSPLDFHDEPAHVAGSDAAGIVWAIGSNVRGWKVGDEVVAHCCQADGGDEECNGGDPMLSPSQRIWGVRDVFWCLRPVRPCSSDPAAAQAETSQLGSQRLLYACPRDSLSHVVRPRSACNRSW